MKKLLLACTLFFGLNVSNAAFVERESAPSQTQNVAPNPLVASSVTSTSMEVNPKSTGIAGEEIKSRKLSFKEKIMMKLFKKKFAAAGGKSQMTALLLVLFVGILGIHRFYLGYTWQGIVQLLTFGGLGIWSLIDLIRIITGDLKPKDGEYETTL